MAKANYAAYATGRDAAYIKPKLIPDYELMARDDSGGPDYDPYTAEFGDGGYVQGEKAHLSAHGGKDDDEKLDEISAEPRVKGYERTAGTSRAERDDIPASSKKYSKE